MWLAAVPPENRGPDQSRQFGLNGVSLCETPHCPFHNWRDHIVDLAVSPALCVCVRSVRYGRNVDSRFVEAGKCRGGGGRLCRGSMTRKGKQGLRRRRWRRQRTLQRVEMHHTSRQATEQATQGAMRAKQATEEARREDGGEGLTKKKKKTSPPPQPLPSPVVP